MARITIVVDTDDTNAVLTAIVGALPASNGRLVQFVVTEPQSFIEEGDQPGDVSRVRSWTSRAILSVLGDGTPRTMTEILREIPEPKPTTSGVSAQCRSLQAANLIARDEQTKKFRLVTKPTV